MRYLKLSCLLPIWICQRTLACIPAFLSCMYVYDLAFLGNCLGHQIFPPSSVMKTTNLPYCIAGGHYCLQILLRCLWLQHWACQTKSNSSGGGKGQQASTTGAIMRQQVATIIQFIPHNRHNLRRFILAPIIPNMACHTRKTHEEKIQKASAVSTGRWQHSVKSDVEAEKGNK